MFAEVFQQVAKATPLVHCITNYVTVNDVANMILACGGSPIMADDAAEVEEITRLCNALVLNIGTLNTRTVASMIRAGKQANALGRPVILDPVGAGASSLRTETTAQLLQEVRFSVIRGNISEIKTVASGSGTTQGVDADPGDVVTEQSLPQAVAFIKELSRRTGAVVAITGAIDLVAEQHRCYVIRNGHPMMSRITGSGCMLTGVMGAFCGANPGDVLAAAAAAVTAMGLCGELAWQRVQQAGGGTGSLRAFLLDAMSTLTADLLERGAKVEIR